MSVEEGYTKIIQSVYDNIDDLLDVKISNEREILESLLISFKIRHNLVHHVLAYALTQNMRMFIEKRAEFYFPGIDSSVARLTPDLILFIDKYGVICDTLNRAYRVVIVDVSVSTVSNEEKEKKEKKYKELAKNIEKYIGKENEKNKEEGFQTMPVDVVGFAVNSNFSNLEIAFHRFINDQHIFIDESKLPFTDMRLMLQSLHGVQAKLKSYLSNEELVDNFFKKEFGRPNDNEDSDVIYNDILLERLPELTNSYISRKRENKSTESKMTDVLNNLTKKKEMTPEDKGLQDEQKFNDICKKMKKLMSDKEIRSIFLEKETTPDKVKIAFENLEKMSDKFDTIKIKPTHQMYTPINIGSRICDFDEIPGIDMTKFRLEQRQIMQIMNLVNSGSENLEGQSFIQDLFKTLVNMFTGENQEPNMNMFNNNFWVSKEFDDKLNEEYHDYRKNCLETRTPVLSEVQFAVKKKGINIPHDGLPRSYKQKMVKIPQHNWSDEASVWSKKAHSGYKDEKKVRLVKTESSCKFSHSKYVDNFLDLMTESYFQKNEFPYNDVLTDYSDTDSNILNFFKKEMIADYKPILKILQTTIAFKYLWQQSLCAEQLMHFTQFSLPSNTYSFFTAGSPNVLYIVNNSYHNAGKDVGKAYMAIGYVYDLAWLTPFFGKVSYKERMDNQGNKYFVFITNWRRTETFKLTFLKDQFYSVLSTSMNALLRHRRDILLYKRNKNEKDYAFDLIKHHFSLKVLISLTSNQRIAEMLSDMRYAIMASFSDFSEIDKLVQDKFSPKYGTVMESWIATRVDNLRKQVTQFQDKENIRTFFKQPIFVQGKRKDESIGGSFEIPSIWTGIIIKDLQDLLDDMFIYVHTLKEPSNIHHENIKAIETILEYQKKYDSLTDNRKKGYIQDEDEMKAFLCSDNPIGHSSEVVTLSCNRTMSSLKAFDLNLHAKKHFSEKVSNITSTKSAIPEYEREIVPIEKLTRGKRRKKRNKTNPDMDEVDNEKKSENKEKKEFMEEYARMNSSKIKPKQQTTIKTSVTKESFLPHTNRSKVHDCMLDVLENNINMSTVFDVAEWNILLNNARVVSDICIKAQYGAKREFYVINVGAKCNARILENIFSEICKVIPNEMISIPGDKKMLVMQDVLNECLIRKGSKQQLIFVNGDCTKWSAAETMECFMSLIEGLEGYLDDEIIKYLLCVVDMWSNKKITIPVSILQNTFFTTEDKTNYLNNPEPAITSKQNFLQGMFNYMSSFKAVCSSNLTKEIWKNIMPDSTLDMTHLEHSDDYSLMILSETLSEAREFRLLHRMVMRLHGFNDSVKKTNTQRFLMEFISLVSLNGHMTYPHIKKLKECGMNLGCTGYRDDVDGAMSRVGESVRVGSVMSSCYFMQKCHLLNVARSYSILQGQRNAFTKENKTLYDIPVEVFGLPDTHPILSFLTKGLSNNYRLLLFGGGPKGTKNIQYVSNSGKVLSVTISQILTTLMKIQLHKQESDSSLTADDFTQGVRLYHPGYIFDIENKLIQKMKANVRMDIEEATAFWDNHKSYNFIKPQNRQLLVQWMRAMYFKHNFALAYSRSSRSQITLRLSTFTSKKCCIVNYDDNNKFVQDSITSYIEEVFKMAAAPDHAIPSYFQNPGGSTECGTSTLTDKYVQETLSKAVMNCDSSVSTLYSLFENARAIREKNHTRSTVAALTPSKINWLNINNQPDALIQYMFNYDDFLLDNRKNKGIASLEADKREILKYYPQKILEESTVNDLKSVYTDIMMCQSKKNLCMTYSSKIQNIEDFVRTHMEFGTIYKTKFAVFTSGATESLNPHTGEIYYKKLYTYTRNEYRLLIDDAVLVFALMKQAYKSNDETIRRTLNNLQVKSEYQFEQDRLILGSEFWEQTNVKDLRIMGCTNNELKSFAFLKNYVTNQIDDIYDIVNADSTYCYQYIRVPFEISSVVEEICEFSYSRQLFRFYLFTNGCFWISTTDNKKHLLTDAYLIGMKLMNKIKLFELERMFGTMPLRAVQDIRPNSSQEQFFREHFETFKKVIDHMSPRRRLVFNETYKNNKFVDFDYQEISSYSCESIVELGLTTKFFQSDLPDTTIDGKNDFVNKKIQIDFDQMAVYNGRRKVFGLPILQAQQSNTTFVRGDLKLNGLGINWWLDSDRIRKLIRKEEIPISKSDFDELTDFFIKDDRILLTVQLQKLLDQLFSLPNRLFESMPCEIYSLIEDRIGKNISSGELTVSAYQFAKEVSIKSGTTMDNASEKKYRENQEHLSNDGPNIESTPDQMPGSPNPNSTDSDGSFNMDDLDQLLDDMSDIEFEEDVPDSDDDVEDEIIKIQEQSSSGSGSSKESLINFQDFQLTMPEIINDDILVVKGGFAKSILESIGDPTKRIIESMYVNETQLDMITTKEKIGLLYRLNDILICTPVISDAEILYTLTFARNILKTFEKSDEWILFEDFVVDVKQDRTIDIFLKYSGSLPPDKILKLLDNGGQIKKQRISDPYRGTGHRGSIRAESFYKIPPEELESYFLIPLNRERKKHILEQCCNSFQIEKFVGMSIIQECYKRLYHDKFVRTGFALELIEELI